MRQLFLILVLTNLGFAAWSRWYAGERAAPSVVTDARTPGITLVSELEEAARAALDVLETPAARPDTPGPASAAAEQPAQGARCVGIGPFQELAQASAAQALLRTEGFAPSQRVVDGEIWVGYWVHLPSIPTRARAAEILAQLRADDLPDAYIVPGGEESQTISLGVFSEISRAGAVREQVRRLGHDATVTDRSRRATLYWLDIAPTEDAEIDLTALQTPGRINRLEQRPCPTEAP